MKHTILLYLFIFLAIDLSAQTRSERSVATAVEQLRKAMVDADSAMLDKLVASKLSYGHSGGAVDNKALFLEKIITGRSDFVTLEFTAQAISVSKNVAMVRHKFHAKTNDGGKPGEVNLAVLLVWQKLHGQWKLLARQAVKIQ